MSFSQLVVTMFVVKPPCALQTMSLVSLGQFDDAEVDVEREESFVKLNNENGGVSAIPAVHGQSPQRLSKWVQRLLNPELRTNDGDVIVQSPEIIPLNDEFIQDFGRREREYDQALGIAPIQIDRDIPDDDDENDVTETQSIVNKTNENQSSTASKSNRSEAPLSRKVKITNIKYTTTSDTMKKLLEKEFGPVESLNLVMKKDSANEIIDKPLLNAGLAYVTFVESSSAEDCAKILKSIDNRPVSVAIVSLPASTSKTGSASGTSGRRYWSEVDLSIQCHRCGNMGHMSYECTQIAANARQRKPCPLCANTTDHSEMYQCPFRVVCFNCGIPGHISRDCSKRKSYNQKQQVERSLCTLCFAINHHPKRSCPWSARNSNGQPHPRTSSISGNAICASCGRSGHYLCSDLKWFFGLRGVSCSNCGLPDHIGAHCNRPNLEVCSRNDELVLKEIERAGTVRSVESSLIEANSKTNTPSRRDQGSRQNNRRRNGDDSPAGARGKDRNGKNPTQRGRPSQRDEPPHFRPFKSMPPPARPTKDQYRQDQSHKRPREYHDGNNATPPKNKRSRYN